MKTLNEWTRKELLALPSKEWEEIKTYESLLLLSTGRKHDSGWSLIAVIGVHQFQPVEIAASCPDDLEWIFPAPDTLGRNGEFKMGQLRMDCAYRSRAMHAWNRGYTFRVGVALSSTRIEVLKA